MPQGPSLDGVCLARIQARFLLSSRHWEAVGDQAIPRTELWDHTPVGRWACSREAEIEVEGEDLPGGWGIALGLNPRQQRQSGPWAQVSLSPVS